MTEHLPWLEGGRITVVLDGAATGGALTMLEIAADSGYVAARHVHVREGEAFLVLARRPRRPDPAAMPPGSRSPLGSASATCDG